MAKAHERFWRNVHKTPWCWVWTGYERGEGYGWFWFRSRAMPAHRWAYEQAKGPVGDGLQLDHLCRNRACVNPDHLQPVTCRTNVLRGNAPPAANARKTHCKRGHLLGLPGKQGRKCAECHRQRTLTCWRKRYRSPEAKLAEAAGRQYHPFDSVRDAGLRAARAGQPRETNPYSDSPPGRARYRMAWFRGFDALV
jgi:hypothetical protein